ncbi:MAG: HAD hydrolase-like protein, partial [Gemmatimonadaceae bacterium]|nr:HAD hydrolase-like protein [Acetobacteraceae bacterium]
MTPSPLRLVIFDCDGVLVDSEGVSARVTAREATRLGWPLTEQQAMERFIGLRLSDMPPMIEAHTGRPVPPGWVAHVCDRLIEALAQEVEAMPGVTDLLLAVTDLGLPYRVASNSSHEEMRVKFARTGLTELMAGRQHSAADVGAGKPAPDV